jgi:CPA1 family monovalent cation:H+ antiporter
MWMVCLVVTVVAVSALARRVDLPAPVLLVVVGVVGSYVPFVPEVRLTAEVVLVGMLPPLLYNAALQTSLIDFKAHKRSILSLSIGLVAFTTVGVGLLVHAVLPGVSWSAAFAIGAVVAPPDAVAATAVARRIGLPRRTVTILEGESLLNDATALVALKTAIAAGAGVVTVLGVGLDFVWTALGGVGAGVVVYAVVGRVRRRVKDPVMDTSVSVVTPFIAYVLAEEVHASGVLAVVVAGLLLGHRAPVLQTASSRIAERLNWRTVSFLLENAVFLLIGLQTSWILGEVAASTLSPARIVTVCVLVLVAVIVLRMVWVFPARYLLADAGLGPRQRPPRSYTAIVGWAGMRGVVTLAAAFAIPPAATHREVLVLIALFVTAATLVVQGLSLPWLVRRLRVPAPDPRADALARADLLQHATQAGLARLDEIEAEDDEQDAMVRRLLRDRVRQRDFAAWERLGAVEADETPSERYARLRLDMLDAERRRVLAIRDEGRVAHEVVEDVLGSLDIEESMLGYRLERRRELGIDPEPDSDAHRVADVCDHLAAAGVAADPPARACEGCLRDGSTWVHLRECLTCGYVGCCDSSPRRHAQAHFDATDHPVVASAEPGERWRWCYVDELLG